MRIVDNISQTLSTQFLKMETIKAVVQNHKAEPRLLDLAERFPQMVNLSIANGLEQGKTSLNSLCQVCYHRLKVFETPSKYRLYAISRAAGILKNYRKLSRKHHIRTPYSLKQRLTICYSLRIRNDELFMPGGFPQPIEQLRVGCSQTTKYQIALRNSNGFQGLYLLLERDIDDKVQGNARY